MPSSARLVLMSTPALLPSSKELIYGQLVPEDAAALCTRALMWYDVVKEQYDARRAGTILIDALEDDLRHVCNLQ